AVDRRRGRQLERPRRGGTRERQTDGTVRTAAPAVDQGAEQRDVLEGARFGGGTGNLIEVESRAEQRPRLCPLPRGAIQGGLLLLVHRRIHAPAGRVAVAPLAPDGERVGGDGAFAEPARQELLGAPVAARHVEVADASRGRRVEELRGAPVERLRRAL